MAKFTNKDIIRLYENCQNPEIKRQVAKVLDIQTDKNSQPLTYQPTKYQRDLLKLEQTRQEYQQNMDDIKITFISGGVMIYLIIKLLAWIF